MENKRELVKSPTMGDDQFNWCKLCHEKGEKEAKKYLDFWLRETARIILDDSHILDVYSYNIKSNELFFEIKVTLTVPWPG